MPLQKANSSNACFQWRGILTQEQISKHVLPAKPPRGIVVTLVLGQNALETLCRFFPSQWDQAIVPQGWDVLLVVGQIYKDKAGTSTKRKQELLSCLKLEKAPHLSQKEWINLDGSTMQTEEYRIILNENQSRQSNKIVVAETELVLPHYIQPNQTLLKVPISPRHCQAPIPYILGTKWYVHEMLHLSIFKDYDYFIKLDTDVVFLQPLPVSLLHHMAIRRAIFGHTGQYPDHIDAPCGWGITEAMQNFLQENESSGQPCSGENPALSKNADLYYSNFVVGRVDFFQSSQVLGLSRFLAEYPQGYFRYRWTDQIFYHYAMGYFVESFENTVVDYAQFRCTPRKDCWFSVHHFNHDLCDNGGVFIHTKARLPPSSNAWQWKVDYDEPGKRHTRATIPFRTEYQDRCEELGF